MSQQPLSSSLQSILSALARAPGPMTVAEVGAKCGRRPDYPDEGIRQRLQTLVRLGRVVREGHYPVRYSLASEGSQPSESPTVERTTVRDTSRPDWLTDQVIADEVEAEKVWTLAGALRAANTAWGIDMGIDADVREARALMEEARRQVRENAPIGQHHREHEMPFSAVPPQQQAAE